jgi:A/G-specific adenine glycosylase
MKEKPTPPKTRTSPGPDGSTPGSGSVGTADLRRLLLDAYDARRRDLPWRGESDPYRVWVSEVMLQQTRVETVVPYYKEWVERFPDLESLASADEEEVLRLWQGLGYYSRARNLLDAARVIRERYQGEIPSSASGLRALPGVGEYTSGAVASIAFGEVVPAVDGNVRRVLSRLFDLPDPSPAELTELAGSLVDPLRPGDFNQALMELGAVTCKPTSPDCSSCPLSGRCLARRRGTQADRPLRKSRRPIPKTQAVVVVASAEVDGALRFLFRKRPPQGLLAGMWEFPNETLFVGESPEDAALGLAQRLGLTPPSIGLKSVAHVFSHLRVLYHPFLFSDQSAIGGGSQESWLSLEEADGVPLPVAQGKILAAALKSLSEIR